MESHYKLIVTKTLASLLYNDYFSFLQVLMVCLFQVYKKNLVSCGTEDVLLRLTDLATLRVGFFVLYYLGHSDIFSCILYHARDNCLIFDHGKHKIKKDGEHLCSLFFANIIL